MNITCKLHWVKDVALLYTNVYVFLTVNTRCNVRVYMLQKVFERSFLYRVGIRVLIILSFFLFNSN